ncbi:MAG TPA: hypothetical protein VJH55_02080 [Candidatus Paceibacterota bacterium]
MNHPAFRDTDAIIQKNSHLIINVAKKTSLQEQFKKAIQERDYKLAIKLQVEIRAENMRKAPNRQYR